MRQVLNKGMIVMAAASGILTVVGGGYAHADASAEGAAVNSPGVGSGNVAQVPVHVPVNACGNTVNGAALLNPSFGNECANVDSGKGHHHGKDAEESDRHGDDRSIHSDRGHDSGSEDASGKHSDRGHDGGSEDASGEHGDRGYDGPGSDSYGDDAYGGNGGASAEGVAANSPGVLSGNVIQAPVHIPVNACGNSVNLIGALNAAADNECYNESGPAAPPVDEPPVDEPPTAAKPPVDKPPVSDTPAPAAVPNVPVEQLAHTGAGEIGMAAGASAALLLGGAVLMRRTRGSRN
ncbi:chaplin [Streptomyces sp. NPDC060035]|uniref:chaplin n=1 Tax=Streptomyces sp. NPDC060035 TaxID=3347044 RepID=UPI003696602E